MNACHIKDGVKPERDGGKGLPGKKRRDWNPEMEVHIGFTRALLVDKQLIIS